MGFLQALIVQLCMAIIEKYIQKGTAAYDMFQKLSKELEENQKKADAYNAVVNNPNSTREEREDAEDIIGR